MKKYLHLTDKKAQSFIDFFALYGRIKNTQDCHSVLKKETVCRKKVIFLQYKNRGLRHELKYIISFRDYYELRNRALAFMCHDEHGNDGRYFIRSLYFDDIMLSDYNQKMDGWNRRRKYRIRIYDLSREIIKFEVKDKYDSCISKVSDAVTMEEYNSIIDGDYGFIGDMIFSNAD